MLDILKDSLSGELGTLVINGDLDTNLTVDANLKVFGRLAKDIKVIASGTIDFKYAYDTTEIIENAKIYCLNDPDEEDYDNEEKSYEADFRVKNGKFVIDRSLSKTGNCLCTNGTLYNKDGAITIMCSKINIFSDYSHGIVNINSSLMISNWCDVYATSGYYKGCGIFNDFGSIFIGRNSTVIANGKVAGIKNCDDSKPAEKEHQPGDIVEEEKMAKIESIGTLIAFGEKYGIDNSAYFNILGGGIININGTEIGIVNTSYFCVEDSNLTEAIVITGKEWAMFNDGGTLEFKKDASLLLIGGINTVPSDRRLIDYPPSFGGSVSNEGYIFSTKCAPGPSVCGTTIFWGEGMTVDNGKIVHSKSNDISRNVDRPGCFTGGWRGDNFLGTHINVYDDNSDYYEAVMYGDDGNITRYIANRSDIVTKRSQKFDSIEIDKDLDIPKLYGEVVLKTDIDAKEE